MVLKVQEEVPLLADVKKLCETTAGRSATQTPKEMIKADKHIMEKKIERKRGVKPGIYYVCKCESCIDSWMNERIKNWGWTPSDASAIMKCEELPATIRSRTVAATKSIRKKKGAFPLGRFHKHGLSISEIELVAACYRPHRIGETTEEAG